LGKIKIQNVEKNSPEVKNMSQKKEGNALFAVFIKD